MYSLPNCVGAEPVSRAGGHDTHVWRSFYRVKYTYKFILTV